ncbi:MAG: hypothetical protein ACRD8W_32510 [Nitrososphaeraceae archaeon]
MTYDSIPIYNYSGKVTVEPISVNGHPAVMFSGLNAVSSGDIVSVSGTNLVTSPKSTGSMNVLQSTTPVVIYGNVRVLNLNQPQGLINTMGDFNQLLQRVDATSIEGKEEVTICSRLSSDINIRKCY